MITKQQILKRILYILENPQQFSQIEIEWANDPQTIKNLNKLEAHNFANNKANIEIELNGDEKDPEEDF